MTLGLTVFRDRLRDAIDRVTKVSRGDTAVHLAEGKAKEAVAAAATEIVEGKNVSQDRINRLEQSLQLLRQTGSFGAEGNAVTSWYERDASRGIVITIQGASRGEKLVCAVVSPSGKRWDTTSHVHRGGTLAAAWPSSFPGAGDHQQERGVWTWSWREEHGANLHRIVSDGGWLESGD